MINISNVSRFERFNILPSETRVENPLFITRQGFLIISLRFSVNIFETNLSDFFLIE